MHFALISNSIWRLTCNEVTSCQFLIPSSRLVYLSHRFEGEILKGGWCTPELWFNGIWQGRVTVTQCNSFFFNHVHPSHLITLDWRWVGYGVLAYVSELANMCGTRADLIRRCKILLAVAFVRRLRIVSLDRNVFFLKLKLFFSFY